MSKPVDIVASMRDLIEAMCKVTGLPEYVAGSAVINAVYASMSDEQGIMLRDMYGHPEGIVGAAKLLAQINELNAANEQLRSELNRAKIDVLDLREANQALRNKLN